MQDSILWLHCDWVNQSLVIGAVVFQSLLNQCASVLHGPSCRPPSLSLPCNRLSHVGSLDPRQGAFRGTSLLSAAAQKGIRSYTLPWVKAAVPPDSLSTAWRWSLPSFDRSGLCMSPKQASVLLQGRLGAWQGCRPPRADPKWGNTVSAVTRGSWSWLRAPLGKHGPSLRGLLMVTQGTPNLTYSAGSSFLLPPIYCEGVAGTSRPHGVPANSTPCTPSARELLGQTGCPGVLIGGGGGGSGQIQGQDRLEWSGPGHTAACLQPGRWEPQPDFTPFILYRDQPQYPSASASIPWFFAKQGRSFIQPAGVSY